MLYSGHTFSVDNFEIFWYKEFYTGVSSITFGEVLNEK
jgi:hypothetical protein